MSLEPQSVNEVANRLAERGILLDPSRVRQLLDELTQVGLVKRVQAPGRVGGSYWLASGPDVEATLDQAYEMVTGRVDL